MEICQFQDIENVIPMQPEVPFSTTTVDNLEWFVQELTEMWKDKSNDKEEYSFTLLLIPKVNVTFKVTWYFIWTQCHMHIRDLFD